jgi:hypothetical protein
LIATKEDDLVNLAMTHTPLSGTRPRSEDEFSSRDEIDFRKSLSLLRRGIPQTAGLALLGVFFAAITCILIDRAYPDVITTRLVFGFPGYEKGEYPDHSKFQPDDVRAPAIIATALQRQGLNTSTEFQAAVRGAIGFEGIVPPNVVKERDRLRAAGQTPSAYVPDEYILTLTAPHKMALSMQQKKNLLGEIVSVYRETFTKTYGHPPVAFGSAFDTLKDADYPEYDLVLNQELQRVVSYLSEQIAQARSFRSQNTNLSFGDLLEETQLFAQIHMNEALGIIRENGLSRSRRTAVTKMDYHLRILDHQEKHAVAQEAVLQELLQKAQTKNQSYVLGVKSQMAQTGSETRLLDQGLIDSLVANDAYNFLVRRALDAGLQVRRVQSEISRMKDVRENMQHFMEKNEEDQSTAIQQAQESLVKLKKEYANLMDNIRRTQNDYAQQEFGNAIRLSDQIRADGLMKKAVIMSAVGAFLGALLGVGLSLLEFYISPRSASRN